MAAYKRILLKLSGEMLGGKTENALDPESLKYFAQEIKAIYQEGIEIGIVVGGGNFIRGASFTNTGFIDQTRADYMGMLATVINGIALQASLNNLEIPTRLINSFRVEKVGEPYNQSRVDRYLKDREVLIFTGGTGNPYFTTDSAAALRANEIHADILIKATKVDGVYTSDPCKDKSAKKFDTITFDEVYARQLKVMDLTAITLCKEHGIRIAVFDIANKGSLYDLVEGKTVGTIIS